MEGVPVLPADIRLYIAHLAHLMAPGAVSARGWCSHARERTRVPLTFILVRNCDEEEHARYAGHHKMIFLHKYWLSYMELELPTDATINSVPPD